MQQRPIVGWNRIEEVVAIKVSYFGILSVLTSCFLAIYVGYSCSSTCYHLLSHIVVAYKTHVT